VRKLLFSKKEEGRTVKDIKLAKYLLLFFELTKLNIFLNQKYFLRQLVSF